MKKLLLTTILGIGLGGGFTFEKASAQLKADLDGVSGDVGKPNSAVAGPVLNFLLNRFHAIDVGTSAYEMRKDGVTERSYVAKFSVSGALVYNHELTRNDVDLRAGKNAGMQVLPYTVSLSDDGRMFISVAGFAWKNMNTAAAADLPSGGGNSYDGGGIFSVVDNIKLLIFEYDDGMQLDNMKTVKVNLVEADGKLDILNSSKPGTFLAITFGADLGIHTTQFLHNGAEYAIDGVTGGINTPRDGGMSFRASVRYGLEFNKSINKWNINSRLGFEHDWSNGNTFDPVKVEEHENKLPQYYEDLDNYQGDNRSYWIKQNRLKHPSAEEFRRSHFYVVPSLNLSRKVNKNDNKPIRLGLGVYGNIPFSDETKGYKNIDFTQMNRELFGAKFFINF